MSSKFLGCHGDLEDLKMLHDQLNAKVLEQANETQELVMINNFVTESNEFQFKKCLEERCLSFYYPFLITLTSSIQSSWPLSKSRIADIDSWRWVLEDLSKRLDEAISSLRYEHKAIRVVLQRIQDELNGNSMEGARPSALYPMKDAVEDAIQQVTEFHAHTLRVEEKTGFK